VVVGLPFDWNVISHLLKPFTVHIMCLGPLEVLDSY